MNKLRIALASLLLLLSLMLPLAVPSVRAQPTNLSLLVVDTIGEPMDLDPAWSYDTSSAEILMNTYETLLWFNRTETNEYTPILATEWSWVEGSGKLADGSTMATSPEGLEWVGRWEFRIRTYEEGGFGIPTFHYDDGTYSAEGAAITTADVEYTFERILLTDCSTGPAWMIFEPLITGYWMGDVNATCFANGVGSLNAYGWNTECDEMIDHTVECNATHVWFNLMMPEGFPFLQIVAQQWGSIMSKDWCTDTSIPGHEREWPGMTAGDDWINHWDPDTSPIYDVDTSSPGLHLDALLGTGPYMFNYWNTGAGGSWSVVKNPNYWRGWTNYDGLHPLHVDEYQSWYIPEWPTRRLRFLGGICDFCAVPRMYMNEVLGEPGIDCYYPLQELACTAAFYTFLVSDTSTRMGVMTANNTYASTGAPPNIFNNSDVRMAFSHCMDYDALLEVALLDEAVSPSTPILEILAPNVAPPGQSEDPSIEQRKMLGVSWEPAGTHAFNLTLAAEYLKKVPDLWANGFTMDFVYNEGNLLRETSCVLLRDGLEWISNNVAGAPTFTINLASIPWSVYKLEWKAYNLPFFVVGWLADYPDAHNFAHPFMHSIGAFSRWQGYMGITEFPTQEIDDYIADGISNSPREPYYEWLNQKYVDLNPGLTLYVPAGRHFQRNWVDTGVEDTAHEPDPEDAQLWTKTTEGKWYYNPIYPGEYMYDLYKHIIGAVQDLDVGISSITPDITVNGAKACEFMDENGTLTARATFTIGVTRYDTTGPFEYFRVGLEIVNVVTDMFYTINDTEIALGPDSSDTAVLVWDEAPAYGGYQVRAVVYPTASYVADTNMANNVLIHGAVIPGDADGSGNVKASDLGMLGGAWDTSEAVPTNPILGTTYNSACDFDDSTTIKTPDLGILGTYWDLP